MSPAKKELSCKGCRDGNKPPIANGGPDQTITLPTTSIYLNGSSSTDPDNNITGYAWIKISGPSSFNISYSNAVETGVTDLVQGVYQFELKVTDAGGLFSKDTVQIFVNAAGPLTELIFPDLVWSLFQAVCIPSIWDEIYIYIPDTSINSGIYQVRSSASL